MGEYREAVTSQSPGLPLRLPWVIGFSDRQPQRGCANTATRSGLGKVELCNPRVEATLGSAPQPLRGIETLV